MLERCAASRAPLLVELAREGGVPCHELIATRRGTEADEPQRPRAPAASHRGAVGGAAALRHAPRQAASRATTCRCWRRRTPPTRRCKRSAKAIRGRGANIFTQWVGDPDALGSAVLLHGDPARAGRRGGPHPHRQPRPSAEPQPGRALRHRAARPQQGAAAARAALHGGHLAAARDVRTPGRGAGEGVLLRGRPPRRPGRGGGELPGPGRARVQAAVRRPARRLDVGVHGRAGGAFGVLEELAPAGGRRPRSASTPTPARCSTARRRSTSGCSRC